MVSFIRKVDDPADFNEPQLYAVRALRAGTATADQQKIALDWIMLSAASLHGMSFRSGEPHGTDFHEGRRFVAAQIAYLLTAPALEELKHESRTIEAKRGTK